MADKSAIGWTDSTWITIYGCDKVSAACGECYIEHTPPFRKLGLKFDRGRIPLIFHHHRLDDPLKWRRPRKVFVNSLSDTFHEDVPDEFIDRMFATMAAAPQHTFQVLTKRPERMREWFAWRGQGINRAGKVRNQFDFHLAAKLPPMARLFDWPLPNVWLGTTIENRSFVGRADVLRDTPAAVRFISAEPLGGPLVYTDLEEDDPRYEQPCVCGCGGPSLYAMGRDHFYEHGGRCSYVHQHPGLDLTDIGWLICGGESGQHFSRKPYRFLIDGDRQPLPHKLAWVRDLRDACVLNQTAFFFKQWGGRTTNWAGRELDGRTWEEFPAGVTV